MITLKVLREAKAHAREDYPNESCGLVIEVEGEQTYIRCKNVAPDPKTAFRVDPEDWAAAEDKGKIVTLVHSHPDDSAAPSEADKLSCERTGVAWLIIAVTASGVTGTAYLGPVGWKAPLLGRRFHHGTLDCYALIRDTYERELGIDLPDFEREDGWWERGENLYLENFEKAGFHSVDTESPREFDVVLMQHRAPVANHAGVFLGDSQLKETPYAPKMYGAFLHHLYGRPSAREVYGGYWRQITVRVLRHKDVTDELLAQRQS